MHINDPIGDLLTRIRNAHMRQKKVVESPSSKARLAVLEVLQAEGYIRGYSVKAVRPGINTLEVQLKYSDGMPVIRTIARVSTPGRRAYTPIAKLKSIHNGLGINILSTSKGVMTDVSARALGIGGEVICSVF